MDGVWFIDEASIQVMAGREWQAASDELESGWKKAVSSKSHPGGVVLESRWMEEWQRMMAASGELASGWKKAVPSKSPRVGGLRQNGEGFAGKSHPSQGVERFDVEDSRGTVGGSLVCCAAGTVGGFL